jgi:hypothetical protein
MRGIAAIWDSWAVRGVMIALRFAFFCHFQKTTAPINET